MIIRLHIVPTLETIKTCFYLAVSVFSVSQTERLERFRLIPLCSWSVKGLIQPRLIPGVFFITSINIQIILSFPETFIMTAKMFKCLEDSP